MEPSAAPAKQFFDYLLVVDFEATCQDGAPHYPNEIIEFPIVVVDTAAGEILHEKKFHSFVRPWRRPKLTPFCKDLTGITQEQVDAAPTLSEVLGHVVSWLQRTFPRDAKLMFATDGPWDFKNFLHKQAVLRDHVSVPTIFYEYVDIRTTFARKLNHGNPIKLNAMLHRLSMRFEGRPHCGYDDTINIARLAIAMMRRGVVFDFVLAIARTDPFCYDLPDTIRWAKHGRSGTIDARHAAAAFANFTGPGRITTENMKVSCRAGGEAATARALGRSRRRAFGRLRLGCFASRAGRAVVVVVVALMLFAFWWGAYNQ